MPSPIGISLEEYWTGAQKLADRPGGGGGAPVLLRQLVSSTRWLYVLILTQLDEENPYL